MTKNKRDTKSWSKPELVRLGTMADVNAAAMPGSDAGSSPNSTKLS